MTIIFKSTDGKENVVIKTVCGCVNNVFLQLAKEFWEKFKLVNDQPFQIIIITWGIFSYYNKIKQNL